MQAREGAPEMGPAFAPEEAAHITLDQLRQSLKMTGDLSYGADEAYYASQEEAEETSEILTGRPLNYEEYARRTQDDYGKSTKDWLTTLLLCVCTGMLGGHCFYTGRIGKGLLYLFTGGLWGLGIIYDLIQIGTGTYRDGEGRVVKNGR